MKADYSLVYSHDYEQEKQDVSGLLFHSVTVNSLHLKIQRNKENLILRLSRKIKRRRTIVATAFDIQMFLKFATICNKQYRKQF